MLCCWPPTWPAAEIWPLPISKPGEIFAPPRFTKHHGLVETSARRTGSQNPAAIPMRGTGAPQAQTGRPGLGVSGRPLGQMFNPPTDIGNRHDQHTSVIGFTNLPVHLDGACAAAGSASIAAMAARNATAARRNAFMPRRPRHGRVEERRVRAVLARHVERGVERGHDEQRRHADAGGTAEKRGQRRDRQHADRAQDAQDLKGAAHGAQLAGLGRRHRGAQKVEPERHQPCPRSTISLSFTTRPSCSATAGV